MVAAQGISSSAEKQASPTATACYVGKHVAEDPDTTRESETLGVIVFESGSGNLDGVPYSAALGPKTVSGVGDSPAYPYPTGGISNPATAILSTATMKGANGGWPILYGSNPVSASAINTAVDEDTLNDSERVHGQDKRTLAGSRIREQDVGFVLTRPDELSYGEVQFSTQPSRFVCSAPEAAHSLQENIPGAMRNSIIGTLLIFALLFLSYPAPATSAEINRIIRDGDIELRPSSMVKGPIRSSSRPETEDPLPNLKNWLGTLQPMTSRS